MDGRRACLKWRGENQCTLTLPLPPPITSREIQRFGRVVGGIVERLGIRNVFQRNWLERGGVVGPGLVLRPKGVVIGVGGWGSVVFPNG